MMIADNNTIAHWQAVGRAARSVAAEYVGHIGPWHALAWSSGVGFSLLQEEEEMKRTKTHPRRRLARQSRKTSNRTAFLHFNAKHIVWKYRNGAIYFWLFK